MSRKIKFRAWDTETKEMSYNFLSKNWLMVCIESPFVELMQYTGVKDRYGKKEIYESDIIKGYLRHQECEFLATVVFENGMFKLRFNEPYGEEPRQIIYEDMTYYNACELEVIGNIYENPDLLKNQNTDK